MKDYQTNYKNNLWFYETKKYIQQIDARWQLQSMYFLLSFPCKWTNNANEMNSRNVGKKFKRSKENVTRESGAAKKILKIICTYILTLVCTQYLTKLFD